MPLLEVEGIRKQFGPTIALDGVTLRVEPGEVHALIGENGAGKSTLMNVLVGAFPPDAGTLRFDGRPYAPASPLMARSWGVTLIHQELCLCPHLTVAENILMGMEPACRGILNRAALNRRAHEVLEQMRHPELDPEMRVGRLALPMRQVVEIGRAIASDARLILMDEPTSSLSSRDVEHLFALIRRLKGRGIGMIYISHFLDEVRQIADRYTVLRDGGSVATGELARTSNDELVTHMVGRAMTELFPRRKPAPEGKTILQVKDLAAAPVLKRASFELRRGRILGIAGLVGAGRTDLVCALFGLVRPTGGTVALLDVERSARAATPAGRMAQGMGYLSEDRRGTGLAVSLSIADNLTMTRPPLMARWGWIDRSRQVGATREWIERLAIKARNPLQAVRTLSGGNQQKVAMARLLHQDAEILLLDEPTRGIDIASKTHIYEWIVRCAEQGKAILMVSSYLPELFGLCDELAVMRRGVLSPQRPLAEWTPESVIHAAIGEADEKLEIRNPKFETNSKTK